MKEGWKTVKLGDVCDFFRGLTYGKTDEVDFSSNIVLRSNNIELKSFKLNLAELKYISDDFVIPSEKRVKKGSLLICTANGSKEHLGKVALIDKDFNYAFGGFMGLLVPSEEILAPYLYYMMLSDSYKKYIKSLSDGANINNLKFKDLAVFELPLPPLEEQHHIVSILDASFEKIDALKKNAEENLKNAKALFQQVLAQELKPKEGWVEKKLGEIGEVFSGFAFKSSSFKTEGRYQIIRIGNIKQDNLRLNESPIFVDIVDDKTISKSLLYKGDLVVTQTGTRHKRDYGFIAMVKNDNLLLNQRNACIRISDVELAKFVLYYSYTKLYKDVFFANEGGTVGQGNVGISALKEMLISFPTDTEEQHRIVRTLDTLSEKCRRLEQVAQQTIRECDALKQSILRQAFSGDL